jgi:pimeloyl-ACP methyl ester carboxylesterase
MDNLLEIRPGRRINLFIHENTTDKPTLFCIHGLGGRGAQWREQIPLLKDRYRLIIPDLLGHGQSEKPHLDDGNPYTFLEFSEDLQALFTDYAGTQNIIMGHSYGGALAANLAWCNQTRIHNLILLAPMSCRPISSIPMVYHLPVWALELLRPMLEKNFREAAFVNTDSPQLVSAEDLAGKNNSLYVIKSILLGMKDAQLLDVTTLEIPTLVIAGENDRVIPVKSMQDFYGKIPHVQFEILANAAHMIMLEQPQKVGALIESFLNPPSVE